MKAYVYGYVRDLTHNYHDGGGAVVVTDGDPLVDLTRHINADNSDYDEPLTPEPEGEPEVFETALTEPRVWIFPDAGCC